MCFAHCVFTLRNAQRKRLSFSVNRRTCYNCALCVISSNAFDVRKQSGTYRILKHILIKNRLPNESEEFVCEILVPIPCFFQML